jgi:hypothetical protein
MENAAKEAEKRSREMQTALKAMEERAAAEEAERAARRELMMMAAGSIPNTQRTDAPKSARAPESARHSAPPTARSARGGAGIPASCRRVVWDSREWCELWDEDEEAYYWYCELTSEAQWDRPGDDFTGDDEHNYSKTGDNSGYQSEGGRTDYTSDSGHHGYDSEWSDGGTLGVEWTEYWDDSASAKYWYNNNTGEASWVNPGGGAAAGAGAGAGAGGAPAAAPASGTGSAPASARKNPNEWVSYVDDSTGQEYWYNAKTGETSWT